MFNLCVRRRNMVEDYRVFPLALAVLLAGAFSLAGVIFIEPAYALPLAILIAATSRFIGDQWIITRA